MLRQCHKGISYDLAAVTKQQFCMCVCVCACGSRRLTSCTMTPLFNRTTCYLASHLRHQYLLQMSGRTCRLARPHADHWLPVCKTQSQRRIHCWPTQHYHRHGNRSPYLSLENADLCFQGHAKTFYYSHETRTHKERKRKYKKLRQ